MPRTVTTNALNRIMGKRLSGWEAARLLLQDSIDLSCGLPTTLTDADEASIRSATLGGRDIRDFNNIMGLARAFETSMAMCAMAWRDAGLDLSVLVSLLRTVDTQKNVELFASVGPSVVTRTQYDDIVREERQNKLDSEYCLGCAIERRFLALVPRDAQKEIDDLWFDFESAEEFVAAIPNTYSKWVRKAFEQIRSLHCTGKLKAIYYTEDAKTVKPLLARWKNRRLAFKDAVRLVDLLYVTGQQLYDCKAVPEWKKDIDEDKPPQYAVLENCPKQWLDESGYYRNPVPPSEWIVEHTEKELGLRVTSGEEDMNTVEEVGDALKKVLHGIEFNLRVFLAARLVIETALEAADLDGHGDASLAAVGFQRFEPFLSEYHFLLERAKKERSLLDRSETKLEQVVKELPAIDLKKLSPTPESRRTLGDTILSGLDDDAWFRTKVFSLEYADGFNFAMFF